MPTIPIPQDRQGQIDVLMKSIAYDESVCDYHVSSDGSVDTVVSRRIDYLGFDFTAYQLHNKLGSAIYAVRLHPTKETYTATTDEQRMRSYAILALWEKSTYIQFWESLEQLETAIKEDRVELSNM